VRIIDIRGFILHLPVTNGSITDSLHSLTHWGAPGVVISTDSGLEGYGFTGTHADLPLDRIIRDTAVQVFGPRLIGHDPGEVQALWHKLASAAPIAWVGRSGITRLAHAAIDVALWDLKSKAAGEPLWKLLGGSAEKRVRAYDTDGGWLNRSAAEVAESAKRSVLDNGHLGVKVKVGSENAHRDVERVEAVREAIGSSASIMIDANGKCSVPEARWLGQNLNQFDIAWFEEPIWHADVANTTRLREELSVPIALGEQLDSLDAFREMLVAGAVDYVQPDAVRLAGVTEWLRVADLAYAHRLPVVSHVGDMMQVHLQLAISHPSTTLLEYIPWMRSCLVEPATVVDGIFDVPQEPGAGTTLRQDAIETFGVS
jgi:L-alanine-DL-glutamate epimerase-like enolase superfamily enzyme